MKRFGSHFESKDDAVKFAKHRHFQYVFEAKDDKGTWFFAWPTPAYNLPVVWQGW